MARPRVVGTFDRVALPKHDSADPARARRGEFSRNRWTAALARVRQELGSLDQAAASDDRVARNYGQRRASVTRQASRRVLFSGEEVAAVGSGHWVPDQPHGPLVNLHVALADRRFAEISDRRPLVIDVPTHQSASSQVQGVLASTALMAPGPTVLVTPDAQLARAVRDQRIAAGGSVAWLSPADELPSDTNLMRWSPIREATGVEMARHIAECLAVAMRGRVAPLAGGDNEGTVRANAQKSLVHALITAHEREYSVEDMLKNLRSIERFANPAVLETMAYWLQPWEQLDNAHEGIATNDFDPHAFVESRDMVIVVGSPPREPSRAAVEVLLSLIQEAAVKPYVLSKGTALSTTLVLDRFLPQSVRVDEALVRLSKSGTTVVSNPWISTGRVAPVGFPHSAAFFAPRSSAEHIARLALNDRPAQSTDDWTLSDVGSVQPMTLEAVIAEHRQDFTAARSLA